MSSSSSLSGSSPSDSSDVIWYGVTKPIKHVNELPVELVLRVFSYLDNEEDRWAFMTTQWRWFNIAVDALWYRPGINSAEQVDLLCQTLRAHSPQADYAAMIRRVNLSTVAKSVNDYVLDSFTRCHQIERFVISEAENVTDEGVCVVLQANPNIQSIDVSMISSLTDRVLEELANSCPGVQGIYATHCVGFTDEGVAHIAAKCPALKRAKFGGCRLLSETGLGMLVDGCRYIMELDISCCGAGTSMGSISDSMVKSALEKLRNLREIRLGSNEDLTAQAFDLKPGTTLESLRLVDLTSCPGITDEAIAKLIQLAPRLHNIVLAKCISLTDRSLALIAQLGHSLHYLHIGHCSQVTDRGIAAIAQNCPRLQYIDVANCNRISNRTLQELSALPRLRRIGLVKCNQIDDVGILAFTRRPILENTLERVHLSYCSAISVAAIKKLLDSCPRLTHLSLTGVPSFMRPELTQFCRDPPPDLTQHQMSVFCVYSGSGVHRLREYLNRNHAHIEIAAFDPQVLAMQQEAMES